MTHPPRDGVSGHAQVVAQARLGSDHRALVVASTALNHATAEFAARRMDKSVARALSGRRIDAVA